MTDLIVDLNCDLGESFGVYRAGADAEVIPWISSANIACGFHAGDPRVMQRTVRLAMEHGVGIGAHPGYPDLAGFGRRAMSLTPDEVRTDVLYQVGALAALVRAAGSRLEHVKPHGQLNTTAYGNRVQAEAIVDAVAAFDRSLILVCAGGELTRAAERAGLLIAHEVYADREYMPDGSLMPRSRPGAVIGDIARVVDRATEMVRKREIRAFSGEVIPVPVDTVCVHGDAEGADRLARAIREGLESAGIEVRRMRDLLSPGRS